MERIDKILSNLGYGSRKEIKVIVKKGEVKVDGEIIKDSSAKVDPKNNVIEIMGDVINYREYIYLIMNKPQGVVSATFDNYDETVIDLLDYDHAVFKPFPVGRLDKDTEGLLIITNDGELNHRLTSPKWHVDKVYYAQIDKPLDEKDIKAFEKGITLDDGYKCMPAKLEIISSDEHGAEANITIKEGKFHQVKRMFESRDKKVLYLKRMSMGNLKLDETLGEGEYRELSSEEIDNLKSI